MQRLRLAGTMLEQLRGGAEVGEIPDPDPVAIAHEVLADARFTVAKESASATEAKRMALEAAAPFVETSRKQLTAMIGDRGNCAGEAVEDYFPPYPHEPAQGAFRVQERDRAAGLCAGCPVRGQCLAFDYACVDGHVQQVWGIMGGLGARDRRELLAPWLEVRARVATVRLAQQNAPIESTQARSTEDGGYQDVEVAS